MTKQENDFYYTRIKVDLIPSGLNFKRDKVELSNVISDEISRDDAHLLINTKHWMHPWHRNLTFPIIILKWKEAMMAFEELHDVYVTDPDYQSFVHGLKWLPPFSQNSMEGEKNYFRWEILTPTEFIFHVLLEIKEEEAAEAAKDKQNTRCDSPHLLHLVTEFAKIAKMIIAKCRIRGC